MTEIYTIGYAGRELDEFIALLRRHEIRYLIDVRSVPQSSVHPEYSANALKQTLERAGIAYVPMGDTLGGRPSDPTCYTPDRKIDYEQVKRRDFFQRGIARLRKAATDDHRVALMCSELKPHECHRAKLIGAVLREQQIAVRHIDETGQLKTQDEVIDRLTDKHFRGGQKSLFGDEPPRAFTSRKSYRPGEDDDP